MQAVIIAGGKGTRLRPLTYGCPKPMLPLFDRPFLVWLIERCRQAGIVDILLNVHYQAQQVIDYFGTGDRFGVQIRYIQESTPLDTAGAVKLAEPWFTGQPLVVFNADILTDLDLTALITFHRDSQAQVTLALTRVADITPFGLVELDQNRQVLAFREKPTSEQALVFLSQGINTINAGTYVIQPDLFLPYLAGEPLSFERVFFPEVLAQGAKVMGFVHQGYWLDIGNPQKYWQAHRDMLAGLISYNFAVPTPSPGVWLSSTAAIAAEAQISAPCFVGDQVWIGANAVIPPYTVLGANSIIDRAIQPGIYAPGSLLV
ncbi:MAG: NDP-sugar synthase [Pseudanabaenaceae cyanobacterium bins.68]|nr:NDP-sugar synthase [Pseudanabaenaceae cyanobacterium bins.68]